MYKLVLLACVVFGVSCLADDTVNHPPTTHEGNAVQPRIGDSPKSGPLAETRQGYLGGFGTSGIAGNLGNFGNSGSRRRCPLCDSSVFQYCGEKLLHDACCCTDPYQYPLPYKCQLADCAFLHANSCREHRLIANCCCSDEYRSLAVGKGGEKSADAVAADSTKH